MAFTDPATDAKHVPLHVMENLISGDVRLVEKMFHALIRVGKLHNASGLFIREGLSFKSGVKAHTREAFSKLPKYDPNLDEIPQDTFSPFRTGNYLKLPETIKVYTVYTEADCKYIDLLVGQPLVGADAEWRC